MSVGKCVVARGILPASATNMPAMYKRYVKDRSGTQTTRAEMDPEGVGGNRQTN